MESKPTFEQAQLHLQVYENASRAEAATARDWFFANFFATNLDEAMRVAAPGTETGGYYMMVVSQFNLCLHPRYRSVV